ncbi:MAG: hypothetical protein EAZ60_05450 [Oscillatoriales cyanobacterium]|nr:MAG: hypothetical protein EAZ83_26620 [Oscillatoriales cyanobacterium]TAE92717.1 MAG: hypothetical protein EAZ79_29170 [Oscillatoriales cyanobacterium]TAF16131.1 MAG: hypothetical protein EAZ73_25690 [Oscillatoriales cyanobacterium]TAF28166.1 MAG: hypothetical protein EAZ69_27300 [Oscillatoriales cyanobacterium]TAF57956.1 MAG: hypothetical protein EAZ60_05450 [Oscillatoriales cyanobacterium]
MVFFDSAQKRIQAPNRFAIHPKFETKIKAPRFICRINLKSHNLKSFDCARSNFRANDRAASSNPFVGSKSKHGI